MKKLTLIFLPGVIFLSLVACGDPNEAAPQQQTQMDAPTVSTAAVSSVAVTAHSIVSARQMQQWTTSCALCHVAGEGGAPRLGMVDHWTDRLAQGKSVLLTHAVEGFNNMPPLGYCMSCEEADLVALIDFMSGDSK